MAGTIFVSNPRRSKARSRARRRNPAPAYNIDQMDDLRAHYEASMAAAPTRGFGGAVGPQSRAQLGYPEGQSSRLRLSATDKIQVRLMQRQARLDHQVALAAAHAEEVRKYLPQAQAVADIEASRARKNAVLRSLGIRQIVGAPQPGSYVPAGGSGKRRKARKSSKRKTYRAKSRSGKRTIRGRKRSASGRFVRNPLVLANPFTVANPWVKSSRSGKRRRVKQSAARRYKSGKRKGQLRRKAGKPMYWRSSRKRNPLVLANPMSNIPVLGTAIGLIGPAFFAAVGVEAIGQVHNVVGRYVEIPEIVQPFTFTIGGLVLAGIAQLLPIPAPIKFNLQIGLASAGGAVDYFRYRDADKAYGSLEMGDGGEWSVEMGALELGDIDELGDIELGELTLGALELGGDEDYSGDDFSMAEGELASEGYGAYMRRHGPRLAKVKGRRGGHRVVKEQTAGVHGKRWLWLLKALDNPADLKALAEMQPDERVAMIANIKSMVRGGKSAGAAQVPPQIEQRMEHLNHENRERRERLQHMAHPGAPGASEDMFAL